jgi:hypothetical protein
VRRLNKKSGPIKQICPFANSREKSTEKKSFNNFQKKKNMIKRSKAVLIFAVCQTISKSLFLAKQSVKTAFPSLYISALKENVKLSLDLEKF